MQLTKDHVKKVAKLANLPLSEEEESKYQEQLSSILDYIDQLNKVDTNNVEPTYNVTGSSNITQKDEVRPSLPQDEVLQNTDLEQNGSFATKGIFENE